MRGRPLDLCVALVAIAWLSVTLGLGFDSAPGRGSNSERATRTPSEQKDAAPGAREPTDLDPGAVPFQRVTPLDPEPSAPVPLAPPVRDDSNEVEPRLGTYCIAARTPKELPFDAKFSILAERPRAFEELDDPRVLDELDYEVLDYDPRADDEEAPTSAELAPDAGDEADDARATVEIQFKDMPLDRPLWLVVHGVNGRPGARDIVSLVRELAPIAADGSTARAEIDLEPHGALIGSWTALAPTAQADEELEELDLSLKAEIRDHPDARQIDHGTSFMLFPVLDGELEVALDAGLHSDRWRRSVRTRAKNGAATELAPWNVLAEPLALTLVAQSEDGRPLEGDFRLEFDAGWSASEAPAGDDGTARLHGDWGALRRVRFTPGVDADFASTEIELSARRGPELVFICARKEPAPCQFMLIARLPNGDYPAASTLSWARRIGESNWRRVDLGYCSGCGGCYSSRFASGTYELCSWMPSKAASFEGRITLPEDLEEGRYLRLSFAPHDTRVVCEVSATLAGYPACEFLRPQLHLDGETLSLDAGPRDASWTQGNSPMTLDLRGLPPGRSFTISLGTADGRALRRLPCKAREGGVCDLGSVVVSLD